MKLAKSVTQENDGYEEEQIHRGADHWLPQAGQCVARKSKAHQFLHHLIKIWYRKIKSIEAKAALTRDAAQFNEVGNTFQQVLTRPQYKEKAMTLDKDYVRIRIASLLEEHMDVNPTSALEDTAFTELHKDFDSLALLELQLLLEKEFSMEFDGFDRTAKIPNNLSEMADALIREYEQYQLRQAKKNLLKKTKSVNP